MSEVNKVMAKYLAYAFLIFGITVYAALMAYLEAHGPNFLRVLVALATYLGLNWVIMVTYYIPKALPKMAQELDKAASHTSFTWIN